MNKLFFKKINNKILIFIKEFYYYYILAFKNYFNIKEKSNRKEFWYFFLGNFLITFFLSIIEKNFLHQEFLSGIYYYLTIIPNFTISIRRLKDIGMSPYWLFLIFFPIIIVIIGTLIGNFYFLYKSIIYFYTILISYFSFLAIILYLYYLFMKPTKK